MQKNQAESGMRPNFVPTSIQRVRAFLGRSSNTRTKPWADSIEVLDALHDTLLDRRGDDAFWADLASLLDSLSGDLRLRMEAEEGSILPNEVLRREGREALISEIRSALAKRRAGRGGFRRLASSLSMPAAGLLVLLGGAMTLGCEDKADPVDTVIDTPADTTPDTTADTTTDTAADTSTDTLQEGDCGATLDQVLASCVTEPAFRSQVDACLDSLDSSFRTGLAAALACGDCDTVMFHVQCLMNGLRDVCDDPAHAGTFDYDAFLDQCATPVYLGIRFE